MYGKTLLLLACATLSGCATINGPPDERDPLESFNRSMYQFNDAVDKAVLKPTATLYKAITPGPVDQGVSNFFANLDDVTVFVNDLLQGKFEHAVNDLQRVTYNTTFGLLGLIDIATPMGFEKRNEDFGQTLGYWGVESGPYLVLPLLGPSSVRDGVGLVPDYFTDPVSYIEEPPTRLGTRALRIVDKRAGLLRAERVMEQAALDPYIFMREAYLQQREDRVYDGNPPAPDFLFDDLDAPGGEPPP